MRISKKYLLLVSTLAICLLVVEVSIRYFFPSLTNGVRMNAYNEDERGKFCQYDSLLGWKGIPSTAANFEIIDSLSHVTQNSFGYRGSEYKEPKSSQRRLLFLGDSFLWGLGVNDDEIFTHAIERQSRQPVQIVNFGVSGFGTDQEFLQYQREGISIGADDVVLMVTLSNDITDNLKSINYGHSKPCFQLIRGNLKLTHVPVPQVGSFENRIQSVEIQNTSKIVWLLKHSYLASLLVSSLSNNERIASHLRKIRVLPPQLTGESELSMYQEGAVEQGWKLFGAILAMLKQEVDSHGKKLTVVLIPSAAQIYPNLWKQNEKMAQMMNIKLDRLLPNRRAAEYCQNLKIPYLDLLPEIEKGREDGGLLYFPLNCHWTVAGHKLVAKILIEHFNL